jgi:hypothetical protein
MRAGGGRVGETESERDDHHQQSRRGARNGSGRGTGLIDEGTVSSSSRHRLIATLLCLALALLLAPGTAGADGDPASDVLVSASPLFLTQSSGATLADKQALIRQLQAAKRDGRPLRLAVIATRSDLGSVTALWERPQVYAEFLGRELSLAYRGELLVVMPNGFGVARDGAGVRTALARLAPRSGRLIVAAEQAIQRLSGVTPAHVAATATAPAPSRVGGVGWWLATGLGLALIAAVWAGSLRRRPPARSFAVPRRPPRRT